MKKIGVVGSRRRNSQEDFTLVEAAVLRILEPGDSLVSGGCSKGADRFAEQIARKHHLEIEIFPANWQNPDCPPERRRPRADGSWYDPQAGFARNGLIARASDVLIACVAQDRTGGTEDTIRKFRQMYPDRPVLLV